MLIKDNPVVFVRTRFYHYRKQKTAYNRPLDPTESVSAIINTEPVAMRSNDGNEGLCWHSELQSLSQSAGLPAEQSSPNYFSPAHPLSPPETSPVKDRGEGAQRSESVSDSPSASNGLTLAPSEGPPPGSVPPKPVKNEGPKKSPLAWEMLKPLNERSSSS